MKTPTQEQALRWALRKTVEPRYFTDEDGAEHERALYHDAAKYRAVLRSMLRAVSVGETTPE